MELPVKYKDLTWQEKREVRKHYTTLQDGKCWHCQKPLDGPTGVDSSCLPLDMRRFPKSFLKWPVHLHHSHKTGLTIGSVHSYFNGVLWQYHGE